MDEYWWYLMLWRDDEENWRRLKQPTWQEVWNKVSAANERLLDWASIEWERGDTAVPVSSWCLFGMSWVMPQAAARTMSS
jgi:hypothetical protein